MHTHGEVAWIVVHNYQVVDKTLVCKQEFEKKKGTLKMVAELEDLIKPDFRILSDERPLVPESVASSRASQN